MTPSVSKKDNNLDYIYPEMESVFDSPAFNEYVETVRKTLKRIGPSTTRAIKTALGKRYQERFNLLDVLERIGVERSWILPTRYSLLPPQREAKRLDWMNRPLGV